MEESKVKKPLLTIADEVSALFEAEGLEPREVLMVLRELESNATVSMTMQHLHEVTVKAMEESGLAEPKN